MEANSKAFPLADANLTNQILDLVQQVNDPFPYIGAQSCLLSVKSTFTSTP